MKVINEATTIEPIGKVAPHPRNPRQGDVGAIHQSIEANGFYGHVVAQRSTGYILAGNHRWLAARQAGAKRIPVTWVDVDDDHALRILLADNRTNDLASYDDASLAELLVDIQKATGDLTGTGYDGDDLDALLADLDVGSGLFGKGQSVPLAERFVMPPFTVLDSRQGQWLDRKRAWHAIGLDPSEGKLHLGNTVMQTPSMALRGFRQRGGSSFDPVLAEVTYHWFLPGPGAHVLDPFAGEAIKGAVAGALGYAYTGVELRAEQTAANEAQWARVKKRVPGDQAVTPTWIAGDSGDLDALLPDGAQYDLVFTSPPYYDLEIYSKAEKDGSAFQTYDRFRDWLAGVMTAATARLRNDRFCVVKVAPVRDKKHGGYHDMVGDAVDGMAAAGLCFYNEAVFVTPVGSVAIHSSHHFPLTRKMGRVHQNVLVFYKGDPRRIKATFPAEVPVLDLTTERADAPAD